MAQPRPNPHSAREGLRVRSAILGSAIPPPFQVQSVAFEGSLVLLVRLAELGRVSLADVPLAPVAEQYLAYLKESSVEDFDAVTAALFALAYLLERKSGLLFPSEIPVTIEEDLTALEATIDRYADVVGTLEKRLEHREQLYFRQASGEPYQLPLNFEELLLEDLAKLFAEVLSRAQADPVELRPSRSNFSIREKMEEVEWTLAGKDGPTSFEDLLPAPFSRLEVVWLFLTALEMARLGMIEMQIRASSLMLNLRRQP